MGGYGKIAMNTGARQEAVADFRHALSETWPAADEARRRNAQLTFAELLAGEGQKNEAVSLLLSVIDQYGDDPTVGTKAADMVKSFGSPEQTEEAYAALANHFPADSGTWLRLGDARFSDYKAPEALDAYQRALKIDPSNAVAIADVARVEDVLHLDPTRRGLPVRERAQCWDEILDRVLNDAAPCPSTPDIEKAKSWPRNRPSALTPPIRRWPPRLLSGRASRRVASRIRCCGTCWPSSETSRIRS